MLCSSTTHANLARWNSKNVLRSMPERRPPWPSFGLSSGSFLSNSQEVSANSVDSNVCRFARVALDGESSGPNR